MAGLRGLGGTVVGILWIETIIASIILGLRLYTRFKVVRNIGWDDYATGVTVLLFWFFTSFETSSAVHGLGAHRNSLTNFQIGNALRLEAIGMVFAALAVGTSKLVVAFVLLRIATRRRDTYFIWSCMFITAVVLLTGITAFFTQCTPYDTIFNAEVQETCTQFAPVATFVSVWAILLDITLALVPWIILAKADMPEKEFLTVCGGLSLGVLAGLCGIIRVAKFPKLTAASDLTFETVSVVLWTSTELLISIVCAAIPALRPLYKKYKSGGATTGWSFFDRALPDTPGDEKGIMDEKAFSDEKADVKKPVLGTPLEKAVATVVTIATTTATIVAAKAADLKTAAKPMAAAAAAKTASIASSTASAIKTASKAVAQATVTGATKTASVTASATSAATATIATAASKAAAAVKTPPRIHNPFKRRVTIYILDDSAPASRSVDRGSLDPNSSFSALIGSQTLYNSKPSRPGLI